MLALATEGGTSASHPLVNAVVVVVVVVVVVFVVVVLVVVVVDICEPAPVVG